LSPVIQINSFDELGDGLVKARIAAGLSQKGARSPIKLKGAANPAAMKLIGFGVGEPSSACKMLPKPSALKSQRDSYAVAPTNYNFFVAKLAQAGLERTSSSRDAAYE